MSNKKLPENATKTEGAELARRGRGEISTATAVPHVSYDDLRHADRITVEGLEVFANHGVYPEENALGQKFIVSLVLYADLRAAGEHDNLDARLTTARYATMSMAICASIRLSSSRLQPRAWPRCCYVVTPCCLACALSSISLGRPSVFPWQAAVSRSSVCANRF